LNNQPTKVNAEPSLFKRLSIPLCGISVGAAVAFVLIVWLTGIARKAIGGSVLAGIAAALLFLAAVVGSTLLISLFVSKKMANRYTAISSLVKGIESGNLPTAGSTPSDPDDASIYEDLGAISSRLSTLGSENAELRSNYDRLSSKVGGLSFNLLTAKSSPAMVRRIMDTISRLAAEGKSEEIVRLSSNAQTILESALADNTQRLPLANELALIKTYLELNEQLTGMDIIYRLSIMCNIVGTETIPQLILPVVANFVEYAERHTALGKYEISVEVSTAHDKLVLTIRDNGNGISKENLEVIRRELESDEFTDTSDTISLSNINRRIALHYGSQYGLKINSSRLGTIVRLYLPEQMENSVQ